MQDLSTQVEAALASGLSFKDRFRTNSAKRLAVAAAAEAHGESDLVESSLEGEHSTIAPRVCKGAWIFLVCCLLTIDPPRSQDVAGGRSACVKHASSACKTMLSLIAMLPFADEAAAGVGSQSPKQQQQQAPPPAAKPKPTGLGLQLTVGSQMETGEWKSGGVWLKKDKNKNEVPMNLQVIAPEDLVKVSWKRNLPNDATRSIV
jgi:hypothetical protein